ncbi:MAG: CHAT domain-containing protein [Cyanobacteria bacterium P01_G01_bin.19]
MTLFLILTTSAVALEPQLHNQKGHIAGDTQTVEQKLEQSSQLFEKGENERTIVLLKQIIATYQARGDRLNRALALRNLALAYYHLGNWPESRKAISDSLAQLNQVSSSERLPVLARTLDMQGYLDLERGQAELALQSWQTAGEIYTQLDDAEHLVRNQISQAQALENMGRYRRAIAILTEVNQNLNGQPDSEVKAVGLQHLGNALQVGGNLEQAETNLQQSLNISKKLDLPQIVSASQVGLGNIAQTKNNYEAALQYYRQAAKHSVSPIASIQAQLKELNLLTKTQQWAVADALVLQIQGQIDTLALNQESIYAQINLADNRLKLAQRKESSQARMTQTKQADFTRATPTIPTIPITSYTRDNINLVDFFIGRNLTDSGSPQVPAAEKRSLDAETLPIPSSPSIESISISRETLTEIAQTLVIANQDAKSLGDRRSESYALGSLGHIYEQAKQWQDAKMLSQQALLLSQDINAPEISYRWQWQLGRILKAQAITVENASPDYTDAIAAYRASVNTLQSLRSDLVSLNPEVQVAFQESVEPIHRELVDLLLEKGTVASPENLEQARNTIESLQMAELDNFFREACLNAQPVLIDQIDRQAAIFYPIILPNRLEIILRLPGKTLKQYSVLVSQAELENTVTRLREALVQTSSQRYLPLANQVYDWLIRPALEDLNGQDIQTLVFISDGVLRNIPMAVLYDGQQFLLEQYAIALTPGLQLLELNSLARPNLSVLASGISEAQQGFSSLPNVKSEIEQIQAYLPSQKILLNQDFTQESFATAISNLNAPIVHLATHGQFSSQFENTFILTWNNRLSINQLRDILLTTGLNESSSVAVELLVLSACETAVGDRQAVLGLAGTAVRAGARSTLGSLWQVSDEATAILMNQFYEELASGVVSKAEALRRAQRSLLKIPRFRQHPFFWASFVIVGNWM